MSGLGVPKSMRPRRKSNGVIVWEGPRPVDKERAPTVRLSPDEWQTIFTEHDPGPTLSNRERARVIAKSVDSSPKAVESAGYRLAIFERDTP